MEPTRGPWRIGAGKGGFGAVVSDHPVPNVNGSGDVEYYGGHLIAESIAPQNRPVIAAAWTMARAIDLAVGRAQMFIPVLSGMETDDARRASIESIIEPLLMAQAKLEQERRKLEEPKDGR